MPQYLWKCLACDTIVEVVRSISDINNPPEAHDCDPNWTRILGPSTFRLNGGGWYADGYAKDKKI